MAEEYEETDRRRGRTPRRTWALMAMVAVITAIAIWLVPVDEKQAPSLPPLPSTPDTIAVPPLSSATDTSEPLSLPPPAGGIATAINGGDRARAFIYKLRADGAQPDADRVFAEAERMQGEGNLEDAYLLYRFAARHGQVQAALILGTQADPAFHAAASGYLPEPDPGQAYRWYSVAVAAGNDAAALSLQALRMRVQQDAEAGDEQARRLLLQWR
jgi:hypothetical protein